MNDQNSLSAVGWYLLAWPIMVQLSSKVDPFLIVTELESVLRKDPAQENKLLKFKVGNQEYSTVKFRTLQNDKQVSHFGSLGRSNK